MTKVQYYTAASLDGFIADQHDSLDWLYAVPHDDGDWLVGGGDLVGQFDDAGLLDEIHLHVTPVVLGAGAPLLPRRITSQRLRFREGAVSGQRLNVVLDVRRQAGAESASSSK